MIQLRAPDHQLNGPCSKKYFSVVSKVKNNNRKSTFRLKCTKPESTVKYNGNHDNQHQPTAAEEDGVRKPKAPEQLLKVNRSSIH